MFFPLVQCSQKQCREVYWKLLTNQAWPHSFSTVRTPETILWLCVSVSLDASLVLKEKPLLSLVESNSNDTIVMSFCGATLCVAIRECSRLATLWRGLCNSGFGNWKVKTAWYQHSGGGPQAAAQQCRKIGKATGCMQRDTSKSKGAKTKAGHSSLICHNLCVQKQLSSLGDLGYLLETASIPSRRGSKMT